MSVSLHIKYVSSPQEYQAKHMSGWLQDQMKTCSLYWNVAYDTLIFLLQMKPKKVRSIVPVLGMTIAI